MYNDIEFVYANLPDTVKGCTVPNEDGGYYVIINSKLSISGRERAIKHELEHIQKDDCYNEKELAEFLEAKIVNR